MSASLQFGPEWMRSKQASIPSSIPRSSHTSTLTPSATQNNAVPPSSLYSSFVTSNNSLDQGKESPRNPFQYSKEEMFQVWRDGGGRGALGVEIELWEGVVKELGGDPIGLKELSESEKQLFSAPLNSELRRRQSHDILPNSFERPKLGISASNIQASSGQPRFSPLLARRRKEEPTDSAVSFFRRSSLSSPLSPIRGPTILNSSLPSPRTKLGVNAPAFDGIIGEGSYLTTDERREDILDNVSGPNHYRSGDSRDQTDNLKTQPVFTTTAFRDEITHRDLRKSQDTEVAITLDDISCLQDVLDKHNDSFTLDECHNSMLRNTNGFSTSGPPGFELDPASITWLYRDPKGNIQGPFSATLMQKWYDEGYFAPDLLVKRSHLDNEWIMVGELAIHDLSGKLFLRRYPEYPSSGVFSRGGELHDAQPFDYFRHSMGQPVVPPDSQIPDHSKLQTTFHQRGVPDHVTILDSHPSSLSPSVQVVSSTSLLGTPHSSERFFNPAMLNRTVALQPGIDRPTNLEPAVHSPNGALTYGRLDNSELHLISVGQFQASPNFRADFNNILPSAWSRSLQAHNETILTQNIAAHNDAIVTDSFGRALYGSLSVESVYSHPPTSSAISISSSSHGKGGSLDGPKLTAHNDDSLHDAGSNVDLTEVFLQNTDLPKDSLTFSHDKPALGEGLPRALSSYHIRSSSQLYSSDDVQPVNLRSPPTLKETIISEMEPTELMESILTDRTQQQFHPDQGSGTFKEQNLQLDTKSVKATSELDEEVVLEPVSAPPPLLVAPDSTPLKPAWKNAVSYGDEVKLRLREIQEAEAKKSEARKLVEREKDRNLISTNALVEETETFPTTWSLSVSQGNSRLSKEPSQQHQPSVSSVHSVPVWPNTGKSISVKKTMKEIQEEEEQKKKVLVKEKEAAQIANRRAYAEFANKSSATQPSNGVWTTVGAGGRHSALVPHTTNPSATRSASTTHTTSQPIASSKPIGNRPTPSISSSSKILPKSNSSPMDSTPLPPSPEFMRWLRDSLRDFNPGFNTEEFMTMLLAFPLDFPPSVVEVIQDMVYMNSVTMDGRRFATEFCSKRKADVANRPKNANGKQPSLADVVKTQPKPSQNELPFKMVKKKGKGLNTGR